MPDGGGARGGQDPMLDVTVVLLDDGLSSTAIMPLEIFHSAGALWSGLQGGPARPRFDVRTVSVDGRPVRSPYGLAFHPEGGLDDIASTDIIVVSTSGLEVDAKLIENSALAPWLRRHHADGAYILGVCMGAAYLAEAGLLNGRIATTHWAVWEDMAARYPQVQWRPDLFVTEDSRLLCSGGVYAAIDLSLYLVDKLCGHEVAVQTAKALLLPMPRINQQGYATLPISKPHDDAEVRSAEIALIRSFKNEVSIPKLAADAGLGERTFLRRFKAATGRRPSEYLQALRIEAAKSLLERDARSIQTISSEVGYDDLAFFRSLFKRMTGMTPGEYRAHFAPLSVRGHAWSAVASPLVQGARVSG